jgi:XTP/dITP diphosphohydrolase
VLEAIDTGGAASLREELGDVLLQVLMHCAIAAEADDGFDIGDVAETTRAKMIHRHPHVFGDTAVDGAAEVVVNWERLKRTEKTKRLSLLDGIPQALPALALAQGVQKRPARLGFDEMPTTDAAIVALTTATARLASIAAASPAHAARGQDWTVTEGEIRREPGSGHLAPEPATEPAAPTAPNLEDAVGELLFAAVALARRLRVNPEDALRTRTHRFAATFRALETVARADGVDLHDLDEQEWRRRWADASNPSQNGPTLSK